MVPVGTSSEPKTRGGAMDILIYLIVGFAVFVGVILLAVSSQTGKL
jgi:hypothetical protein